MNRRTISLLVFGAICAITPFLVRPVTIVEVTSDSGTEVQVHGWTQLDETVPRAELQPRATPFRLVLRGSDLQAHFATQDDGQRFEVQAVRRRAWLPLVRVGGVGSTITLEGRVSHLGMRAR